LIGVKSEEREVLDLRKDRRVQVTDNEAVNGVGVVGCVEFLHQVVDNLCKDVVLTLGWHYDGGIEFVVEIVLSCCCGGSEFLRRWVGLGGELVSTIAFQA
jgi:hypothetical protein